MTHREPGKIYVMTGDGKPEEDGPEGEKTERMAVFISYSRADLPFADELQRGLEFDGGFEVFIDRDAIHEGEDWKQRLAALIASADAIAFLLSPHSVASPVCHWEVAQAQAGGKRIVPVLLSPVDGATTPRALADLNYVRFDQGRSFMAGLAGLRRALRADIKWLREHTRLGQRAQEWMSADRAENRLLLGPDILAARTWLDRRPTDAAPPTELHHDFIAASEAAEAARTSAERARSDKLKRALGATRMAAIAAAGMLVVAAGAGGIAAVQAGLARDAERAATHSASVARKSEATATSLLADSLSQRGLDHFVAGRKETGLRYALLAAGLSDELSPSAQTALKRMAMALLAPSVDSVTHTLVWSGRGPYPQVWLDADRLAAISTDVDRVVIYGFDAAEPTILMAPVDDSMFHYDPVAGLLLATDGATFFTHTLGGEPDWRQIDACKGEGRYQPAGALRAIVLQCLSVEGDPLPSPSVIEPVDAGAAGAREAQAISSMNGAFVAEFDEIDWRSLRVYRVGDASPLKWPEDAYPRGYIFAPPHFFANATRLSLPGDSVSSTSGSNVIVNLPAAGSGAVTVAAELTLDRFGFGEVASAPQGDLAVTGAGELSDGDLRVWSVADAKTVALLRGSARFDMPTFNASGQLIAAMAPNGQIGVWTIAGELLASAGSAVDDAVRRFAFLPSGDRIALLIVRDRIMRISRIDLTLTTQPISDIRKASCAWLANKTADNPLSGVEGDYFSDGPGDRFTPDELAYDPVLASTLQRLDQVHGAEPSASVCR